MFRANTTDSRVQRVYKILQRKPDIVFLVACVKSEHGVRGGGGEKGRRGKGRGIHAKRESEHGARLISPISSPLLAPATQAIFLVTI